MKRSNNYVVLTDKNTLVDMILPRAILTRTRSLLFAKVGGATAIDLIVKDGPNPVWLSEVSHWGHINIASSGPPRRAVRVVRYRRTL